MKMKGHELSALIVANERTSPGYFQHDMRGNGNRVQPNTLEDLSSFFCHLERIWLTTTTKAGKGTSGRDDD